MQFLIALVLLTCLLPGLLKAQSVSKSDTTMEATVSAGAPLKQPGFKQATIDSLDKRDNPAANLSDLLALKTPVFIKTNGLGGLATPSLRGTGASHTSTYWNGIPLNSPMLGQVDLSLFSASGFGSVYLNFAGGSLRYGTGGLGGSIHLDNVLSFNAGRAVSAQISRGSFGLYTAQLGLTKSGKSMVLNTHLSFRSAQNNFPFHNLADSGQPLQQNTHADLLQLSLLQNVGIKLSRESRLQLSGWWQYSNRNLAPPVTQALSGESQHDRALRVLARYQNTGKTGINVTAACVQEGLLYANTLANYSAQSSVTGLRYTATLSRHLSERLQIHSGAGGLIDYCRAEKGFTGTKVQNRNGAYAQASWYPVEQLSVTALLRADVFDSRAMPALPAVSVQWKQASSKGLAHEVWLLRLAANRNFRAPTLNDKYWQPSGNPYLQPELGWNEEAGLSFSREKGGVFITTSFTGFSAVTDNWIIWLPGVSGFWSAQNVKKVWSRGLEAEAELVWKPASKTRISAVAGAQLTRSEAMAAEAGQSASLHKQLIYTPQQNLQATLRFQQGGLWLSFEQTATGQRFITTDNTSSLPAYYLSNLATGLILNKPGKGQTGLQFRVNNVFGYSYQSVALRAMPQQSYTFTLTYYVATR